MPTLTTTVLPDPPNGENPANAIPIFGRLGQAEPSMQSITDTFDIFHLNPQGIETEFKRAKFDTLLQNNHHPAVVAVTETWLSRTVGAMHLAGYKQISRLDRRVGRRDRGGVALFALNKFAENIVHIGDSQVDERSWQIVHCDCGPVLLGVWYRPPHRNEIDSIRRFESELSAYSKDTVATMIVGDMNVHNKQWLRHSYATHLEGTELEMVCCSNGLRQLVKEPSRGPYLPSKWVWDGPTVKFG